METIETEMEFLHIVLLLHVTIVFLLRQQVGALRLLNVSVPPYLKTGESPRLECSYDAGTDQLHSVSWYKDNEHIYSFTTRHSKKQVFDVEGVRINVRKSNLKDLFLQNVSLNSTGYYACEVNTDSPPFKSVKGESYMEVIELPRNKPKITGEDRIYATGDILSLNCTSDLSHPAAQLQWFINGVPIDPDSNVSFVRSRGLYSTRSNLRLELNRTHMAQSSIGIKCTSTVQPSSLVKQPFKDVKTTEIYVQGHASLSVPSVSLLFISLLLVIKGD